MYSFWLQQNGLNRVNILIFFCIAWPFSHSIPFPHFVYVFSSFLHVFFFDFDHVCSIQSMDKKNVCDLYMQREVNQQNKIPLLYASS